MKFYSLLNRGIEPEALQVEVSSTLQIPSFHIIGLPSPEVAEARERVRAAILSSGIEFPNRKIVVNLAPSSVHKFGTGADLAIALGIIGAPKLGLRDQDSIFAWGELGLGGEVKSVGQISRALSAALRVGASELWISADDLKALTELKLSSNEQCAPLRVVPLSKLEDIFRAKRIPLTSIFESGIKSLPDAVSAPALELDPVLAKTLELSVSGFHHLLLLGPKGVGKSQALEWMEYLVSTLVDRTSLQRSHLLELSDSRASRSPVRRVGVHVRPAALIGSFQKDRLTPGEFSMADGGCLLADEFPEWPRDSREALREPLERGRVHLTRLHASIDFPARFLFVANGNLCPCGGVYGSKKFEWASKCRCRMKERVKYMSKMNGPVLDRIDLIHIHDSPSLDRHPGFDPENWVEKIKQTRSALRERFGKLPGELTGAECESLLDRNSGWKTVLDSHRFTSLRERHKVFRVALTEMTLAEAKTLNHASITHALQYRRLPETLDDGGF